ncbi:MAG: FtsQ-type POTRA domain-containing protein [Candidatus Magasanikbacteria bacterium]
MPIKKIINHHRLQRKINNKIKSTKKIFNYFFNPKKTRRDFSWEGREVENPFIHEKISKKLLYFKILLLIASVLITFSIFLFHPFFIIEDVKIDGLQRISKVDLLDTVNGILNYRKFGLIKENSYILSNVNEIKDILKERYPIEKIIVKKSFPNKLSIIIQEKISTIIYDNGLEYSYVDLEGKIVEIMGKTSEYDWKDITAEVATTTESGESVTSTVVVARIYEPDVNTIKKDLGSYPIIYDKNNLNDVSLNLDVLDKTKVNILIDWFKQLDNNEKIPLKYFVFEDNSQDLTIKTYKGFYIKTRFDREVTDQINKLNSLYKEKIDENKFLEYIDLRYPDRIYWK